jgi:hypothetical protein
MNKNYLLVISFVFIVLFFQGQPGPGPVGPTLPGGGAAPPCWPPPCIPVDGGISIFTFLSILFGYKFLSKNK